MSTPFDAPGMIPYEIVFNERAHEDANVVVSLQSASCRPGSATIRIAIAVAPAGVVQSDDATAPVPPMPAQPGELDASGVWGAPGGSTGASFSSPSWHATIDGTTSVEAFLMGSSSGDTFAGGRMSEVELAIEVPETGDSVTLAGPAEGLGLEVEVTVALDALRSGADHALRVWDEEPPTDEQVAAAGREYARSMGIDNDDDDDGHVVINMPGT